MEIKINTEIEQFQFEVKSWDCTHMKHEKCNENERSICSCYCHGGTNIEI